MNDSSTSLMLTDFYDKCELIITDITLLAHDSLTYIGGASRYWTMLFVQNIIFLFYTDMMIILNKREILIPNLIT